MNYQARFFLFGTFIIYSCLFTTSGRAQVTGEDILQGMGISETEIESLESGGVLAYSDKFYENSPRELAADAIILVNNDLSAVHAALKGATTLIPAKRMVDHGEIVTATDFSGLKYDDEDFDEVQRLFAAQPGKEFNFSAAEFTTLQGLLRPHRKANRENKIAVASDAIREIMIGRYNQYRAAGLNGISEYKRSRRKQIDVGRELLLTTETFEPFANDFPDFFHVMKNFPDGTDCCENYFRWLKVEIRDRPIFALSHTIIQETDDFVLYTERHYFVNNTLNSIQITLGWVPYGEGTYMGIAMSASADILDSMMGRMLRPLGRNKAKDLVIDVMQEIRDDLTKDVGEEDESM